MKNIFSHPTSFEMPESELNKLFLAALSFRKAIENTNKSFLPITFKNFPRGSCGDTVPILGYYLEVKGFGEFDYVLGYRNSCSHAWLQQNNLIIDITADQYQDQKNKVIVLPDSEWHRMFNGSVQHKASIDIYETSTYSVLLKAYHSILENIK